MWKYEATCNFGCRPKLSTYHKDKNEEIDGGICYNQQMRNTNWRFEMLFFLYKLLVKIKDADIN